MKAKVYGALLTAACAGPVQAAEVRLEDDVLSRMARAVGRQIGGNAVLSDIEVRAGHSGLALHGVATVDYRTRPIATIWSACGSDTAAVDGEEPAEGELMLPALLNTITYHGEAWAAADEALRVSMGAASDLQLEDVFSEVDPAGDAPLEDQVRQVIWDALGVDDEGQRVPFAIGPELRAQLRTTAYVSLATAAAEAGLDELGLLEIIDHDLDRLIVQDVLTCNPMLIYWLGQRRQVVQSFTAPAHLQRDGNGLRFLVNQASLTVRDPRDTDRVIAQVPLRTAFSIDEVARLRWESNWVANADRWRWNTPRSAISPDM